ncbi:MAG TPA: cytochrome c, partial [Hymenobacter sp.]|nr:cytochrome c [Hymenobacter sp.]
MDSIRLRSLFRLFLALFLTFAAVGNSSAQDVGAAPAVSKEGVTPGATAAATPASATAPAAGDAAAISAGDALFKGNCAQCHAINDVVVGPALAGISKRRPVSWLIPWIRNSSKMVASGDEYAVKIYNQYQKQQMPSFQLSDTEITSILAWITAEEGKSAGPPGAVTNIKPEDGTETPGAAGAAGGGQYVDILLIVLVVVLIVLVVTLVIIANIMKDVLRGRRDLDGRDVEILDQRTDWTKLYKSPVLRGIAGTVFVLAVLYASVQGAMGVGLTQGYQPTQPIAFSH